MMKQEIIVRLDDNEDFRALYWEIQRKYPDNPLKQLEEWDKQPSKYRVLGVAKVCQNLLNKPNHTVNIERGQIELLYRTIIDLARHLQPSLPDGVYDYNYHNINGVSKNIAEQLTETID